MKAWHTDKVSELRSLPFHPAGLPGGAHGRARDLQDKPMLVGSFDPFNALAKSAASDAAARLRPTAIDRRR